MEKSYYKEYYYQERNHWWFRARNGIISEHLKKITSEWGELKILNVGAGTGYSSQLLSELGKVESVEIDEDCCHFVKNTLGINMINCSALSMPYESNSFDLVCAFDVIEHIENDYLAMKEMVRVCKRGGIICITVPAFMFLWGKHDIINHHVRRYTLNQIKKLFKNDGEEIFGSYFNFFLFFPIAAYRVLERIIHKIIKPLTQEKKSDFSFKSNKIVDTALYRIFAFEKKFLKKFINLPCGVSILYSLKKN